MQLAIAAHPCNISIVSTIPSYQHFGHMMEMEDTSTPEPASSIALDPLCAKHCIPDNLQHDNGDNPLLLQAAMILSYQLAPVPAHPVFSSGQLEWLFPYALGPPQQIRFCRFRE